MAKTTVETITCDRCGKTKSIVDGKNAFDANNVFHYDVPNPTDKYEEVDLCHDCYVRLGNTWKKFLSNEGN